MTLSKDEPIRSALQDLAEQPCGIVDRAREDVLRRIARRRRRRRAALGATILVSAAVAVLLIPGGESDVVVDTTASVATSTAAPEPGLETLVPEGQGPPDSVGFLTLERIEASDKGSGTERVVLVFDRELPSVPVYQVDKVASSEPSGVSYTAQLRRSVTVCDSVHSFPPPFTGSVDIMMPADWFDPESESYQGLLVFDSVDDPVGKIVACVSGAGFVQVSIWGAASGDPGDVSVSIEANVITIEITPRALTEGCPPTTPADGQSGLRVLVKSEPTTWLEIAAMLEIEAMERAGPEEFASSRVGEEGARILLSRARRPDDATNICVFEGRSDAPGSGGSATSGLTARMVGESGSLQVLSLTGRPATDPMMPSEYSDRLDDGLRDAIRSAYEGQS